MMAQPSAVYRLNIPPWSPWSRSGGGKDFSLGRRSLGTAGELGKSSGIEASPPSGGLGLWFGTCGEPALLAGTSCAASFLGLQGRDLSHFLYRASRARYRATSHLIRGRGGCRRVSAWKSLVCSPWTMGDCVMTGGANVPFHAILCGDVVSQRAGTASCSSVLRVPSRAVPRRESQ